MNTDKRAHPFKRWASSLFTREALCTIVCVYLLVRYSEQVIEQEFSLLFLIIGILAPPLLMKLASLRWGRVDEREPNRIEKPK